MKIVADLQIHSKYSRAVSPEMVIPRIWEWAKRKGIRLMATGDWTHPLWIREIKNHLEEMGNGILKLKMENEKWKMDENDPFFLLATEISSIYSQGGKLRRIHTLFWVPTIDSVDKINKELTARGANLLSDGRPIVGLSAANLAELVLSIDDKALVIPAHCWTPWFSLYGSESGFDSVDECFGPYAKYIYGVETGLSSDPLMNWRIKELENRAILSFSDAHSGPKIGREATVFNLKELSFEAIREAIIGEQRTSSTSRGTSHIASTLEFYPEEGKYHFTGHRNCGIKQTPEETVKKGTTCPVCGRKLTVGVMHRVEQLAGRGEIKEEELNIKKDDIGVKWIGFKNKPPFVRLVPLQEILSETIGGMPTSVGVQTEYRKLTDALGGEFTVLLKTPLSEIEKVSGGRVAQAIGKVRSGDIYVDPGFDGVFGKVEIWKENKEQEARPLNEKEQLSLF